MTAEALPVLSLPPGGWEQLADPSGQADLSKVIARILPSRRWFGSKSREIRSVALSTGVSVLGKERGAIHLSIFRVTYAEGEGEWYFLPLARARDGEVPEPGILARLVPADGGFTLLADGFFIPETGQRLLREIVGSDPPSDGLERIRTAVFDRETRSFDLALVPEVFRGEQSNTSLLFGRSLMLKGFRRLEPGMNPDLEVGAYLARSHEPVPIPDTFGALIGKTPAGDPLTLGLLQRFVDNQGDGWSWCKTRLSRLLEGEENAGELDGMIDRLGRQTARLHRALARLPASPDFEPLPFQEEDLSRMAFETTDRFDRIRHSLIRTSSDLPSPVRDKAQELLSRSAEVAGYVGRCRTLGAKGQKIRCHGDFHLGQVLVTTEGDVVFLDFEGEPALPLSVRRLRNTPLVDVAGMLRSLHYLVLTVHPEDHALSGVKEGWYARQVARYLLAYGTECGVAPGLLPNREAAGGILGLCLLRKALYETEYELNNRPAWLSIPLSGILHLIGQPLPVFGDGT